MEVYNRYHNAMFNTALRIVKDSAEAEDIMQESFLTAFNKLDSFNGEATFGSWLIMNKFSYIFVSLAFFVSFLGNAKKKS